MMNMLTSRVCAAARAPVAGAVVRGGARNTTLFRCSTVPLPSFSAATTIAVAAPMWRTFASDAADKVVPAVAQTDGMYGKAYDHASFESMASRDAAIVKRKNIPVSPKKFHDIARLVRGLSVNEALIQMKFCEKGNASHMVTLLKNAQATAVHNFSMNKDRLFVANVDVAKGEYLKRVRYRSRGRMGLMFRYRSNVRLVVREQPYTEGEKRVGRWGRNHSTIERTLAHLNAKHASGVRGPTN
jgi:large subunit ribosomal protein L22